MKVRLVQISQNFATVKRDLMRRFCRRPSWVSHRTLKFTGRPQGTRRSPSIHPPRERELAGRHTIAPKPPRVPSPLSGRYVLCPLKPSLQEGASAAIAVPWHTSPTEWFHGDQMRVCSEGARPVPPPAACPPAPSGWRWRWCGPAPNPGARWWSSSRGGWRWRSCWAASKPSRSAGPPAWMAPKPKPPVEMQTWAEGAAFFYF